MSDDNEDSISIAIEEIMNKISNGTPITSNKIDLEDFDFTDVVNMHHYLVSQDHLVNDMKYKLNHRKGKLVKKMKKDKLYGVV